MRLFLLAWKKYVIKKIIKMILSTGTYKIIITCRKINIEMFSRCRRLGLIWKALI